MLDGSQSVQPLIVAKHLSAHATSRLLRCGKCLAGKISRTPTRSRRRFRSATVQPLLINAAENVSQQSGPGLNFKGQSSIRRWFDQASIVSSGKRRPRAAGHRSFSMLQNLTSGAVQRLEPRLLLTIVDFSANRLTVQLTGSESELVFANSGTDTRIRVDGNHVGGHGTSADGRVDSNAIFQIVIVGNEHGNAIDLHNVFRTQTRYRNLQTVNIFGEGGDDSVTGSAFDDLVNGGAGNDSIAGDIGNDTLIGGDGDDTLNGGVGMDSLAGGQGLDTIYATVSGPHPDSTDDDFQDVFFAVEFPEYNAPDGADYAFDPDTGQNLRLLTGEYGDSLPAGLTVYGEERDFKWGLSNYNGEWSNPVFNITGDYVVVDARSPDQNLLSDDTYSLIINVNTGDPEYVFSPALANFRWSLNPETPTRFYDVTGDSVAFLKIGDLENGITRKVRLQNANGESFGVVQSKAGVMMGTLGGRSGEFLAVLESTRQSPTQRTIEAAMVLDLAAAEAEDWDKLIVARYDLSGMIDASDDLYSAPDASFLALGDNRSGEPGALKDRFVMIKLGEMPDIPGSQRLDEPNGTAGLMWSWPLLNVPSALFESSVEEPGDGLLPFKLAHPTFAYGADQQVYFVGGLSLSMVGQPVDLSGGNVINYQSGSTATVGSLIAVNTVTGDFHLLTPGVNSNGQFESLVDHVSGTNQVRSTGGYVFASYNTLAHRSYSGDYVRVTLGAASPEEHQITRVTQNRSGAWNNTEGVSCPECQFFPNSSPDGSKLLLTSTFGVDVSRIDPASGNAPAATKTFLVDFSLQGTPVVNRMPEIRSGDVFETIEGMTFVATVMGIDADPHDYGSLKYSLSGVDDGYLTIDSATGVLRFNNPPDFDAPNDVDQDNVYHVNVAVSDSVGETVTQAVSVRVVNAEPRFTETRTGSFLNIGTNSEMSDEITLEFQDANGGQLVMTVSYDRIYVYSLSSVDQISIDLGAGSDTLFLQSIVPDHITLTISGGDDDDFINTAASGSRGVALIGGTGGDTLIAGSGNDTLVGGPGHDYMDGRSGNDSMVGSAGDDTLIGATGDDSLFGHGGRDLIYGNHGDDFVSGNEGDDSLLGGDGDDSLLGHGGEDTIQGGAGVDWIAGSSGNDVLNGNADNDTVTGGSGLDVIVGGSGDDLLSGDSGNDTIAGNAGADVLLGQSGDDSLIGDSGSDTLDGGAGMDQLAGGLDSDLLVGGADDDYLDGGIEQDSLATGGGSDTIVDTEDDFIDEAFVNWFEAGFVAP